MTRILDWQGAPDMRKFPDQTAMALSTDSKRVTDAGRVDKGYGTLTDGAVLIDPLVALRDE